MVANAAGKGDQLILEKDWKDEDDIVQVLAVLVRIIRHVGFRWLDRLDVVFLAYVGDGGGQRIHVDGNHFCLRDRLCVRIHNASRTVLGFADDRRIGGAQHDIAHFGGYGFEGTRNDVEICRVEIGHASLLVTMTAPPRSDFGNAIQMEPAC